ncbi:MAG: TIGR02301 family protein [Ahrensia sp.]
MNLRFAPLLTVIMLTVSLSSGIAQTEQEAPYDDKLNRLAEVMGSVHYLTNLCGEPSNTWRDEMQRMLSLESPEPNRRSRLIASFNRGFRSFDSVYNQCTPQAETAVARYIDEGVALSTEISARFGE